MHLHIASRVCNSIALHCTQLQLVQLAGEATPIAGVIDQLSTSDCKHASYTLQRGRQALTCVACSAAMAGPVQQTEVSARVWQSRRHSWRPLPEAIRREDSMPTALVAAN